MIWKIDSNQYKKEQNFHVKVTPDDRYVVSSGYFLTVRDIKTAKKIWSIRYPFPITKFVISNDCKFIIICGNKIEIRDLYSGDLVKTLFSEKFDGVLFNGIAISHNDKYIAGSVSGLYTRHSEIWDMSGNLIHRIKSEKFEGGVAGLEIDFSPDDKYLATTDISRKSIEIWELSTGRLINRLKHEDKINSIKFISRTNSLMSSFYNGYIFIWDYLFKDENN